MNNYTEHDNQRSNEMKTQTKHTATPWYKGIRDSKQRLMIYGHDENGNNQMPVMILDAPTKECDIDNMLKAVNNHEKLRGTLFSLLDYFEVLNEDIGLSEDELMHVEDIKKALKESEA